MDPADDTPQAEEFAAEWVDLFPRAASAATLAKFQQWRIMLGAAPAQIAWDRDGPLGREPTLHVEHPTYLQFSEETQRYTYQTKSGMQDVVPGDGHWVLFEEGSRGYMNGAVRALAELFLIRRWGWRDFARYCERHGLPMIKALVPAMASDESKDQFWEDLLTLGGETTFLLPQGVGPNGESFDLSILEASDANWRAFQEIKNDAGTSMAIYLLGQNLTTEVEAGSFAAATVHKNVKTEVLQADERELTEDLFEQFVKPVSALLRPNGADIAPYPHWDTTPPEDLKTKAETLNVLSAVVDRMTSLGVKVDLP